MCTITQTVVLKHYFYHIEVWPQKHAGFGLGWPEICTSKMSYLHGVHTPWVRDERSRFVAVICHVLCATFILMSIHKSCILTNTHLSLPDAACFVCAPVFKCSDNRRDQAEDCFRVFDTSFLLSWKLRQSSNQIRTRVPWYDTEHWSYMGYMPSQLFIYFSRTGSALHS